MAVDVNLKINPKIIKNAFHDTALIKIIYNYFLCVTNTCFNIYDMSKIYIQSIVTK